MCKIDIIGDIHGEFEYLNNIYFKNHVADILLCCGDFGYWINETTHKFYHDSINNGNCKVYFCDGNHENHLLLKKLVETYGWKEPIEIRDNVFYCPRGSNIVLPNGERVLFFGGAESIDMQLRFKNIDWFPEENISEEEIDRIDYTLKYDIVISHTCPSIAVKDNILKSKFSIFYPKFYDSNMSRLQMIYDKIKPSKWFFGHWHTNYMNTIDGCKFIGLNMFPKENYFYHYS